MDTAVGGYGPLLVERPARGRLGGRRVRRRAAVRGPRPPPVRPWRDARVHGRPRPRRRQRHCHLRARLVSLLLHPALIFGVDRHIWHVWPRRHPVGGPRHASGGRLSTGRHDILFRVRQSAGSCVQGATRHRCGGSVAAASG